MNHEKRSVLRTIPGVFFLCAVLGLLFTSTGCVTAPVTYKTTADATAKVPAAPRVSILPIDVEVEEISAGGVTEKRADWARTVSANLTQAIARESGYVAAPSLDSAVKEELDDIQALVRRVSQNHLNFLFGPAELSTASKPLAYELGSIERLGKACNADALLFVFARDAYSSGGRKALVALGFAIPAPALATAALVEPNGRILWFNYYFAQNVDLRESNGAATLISGLLAGLPKR